MKMDGKGSKSNVVRRRWHEINYYNVSSQRTRDVQGPCTRRVAPLSRRAATPCRCSPESRSRRWNHPPPRRRTSRSPGAPASSRHQLSRRTFSIEIYEGEQVKLLAGFAQNVSGKYNKRTVDALHEDRMRLHGRVPVPGDVLDNNIYMRGASQIVSRIRTK